MGSKRRGSLSLADIITSTPLEGEGEESVETISRYLKDSQQNNLSHIASASGKSKRLRGDGGQQEIEAPKTKKSNKTSQSKAYTPFCVKYMKEVLLTGGLVLSDDPLCGSLTKQASDLQRDLQNTLESNVDYPRNVAEFIKGIKHVTKDEEHLKQIVTKNITLTIEQEENPLPDSDSNLLQLLLNVPCLQESLMEYVFERATELAIDDKATSVQLLIKPFMFLDSVGSDSKLINGIIDLMDIAGSATRQEIITSLPNMIKNVPHDNVILELAKYLSEDQSSIPTILDCLSFLCLSCPLKERVNVQMLSLLKTSPSPNFFPNLIQFFFTGTVSENTSSIVKELRERLDWTLLGSQSTNVDIPSSQVLTMLSLKNAFVKCKNLPNLWIDVINRIKIAEETLPIDVVILLIIYSTSSAKESVIEGVFRKRIKESLFKNELLDEAFKLFCPVLKEYLKEMLKIARALLKTRNEPLIIDFASHWFMLLFKQLSNCQKTVVKELLIRDYSENDDTIKISLNILTKIAEEDIKLLKPHSLQIFALKDTVDSLSIDSIHLVMDLLAGLAYGVENSFLDGDIRMMISKQICSSDIDVKIQGILLGIMSVKHLIFTKVHAETEQHDDTESSCSEINNLPEGPAKDAATILELLSKSVSEYPELMCLFYDELSHLLSTSKFINDKFINWLSSYITNDLTNLFIVDVDVNTVRNINGIPIDLFYSLHSPEEADEPIALNIAGLCLDDSEEGSDLRILPSLLRLTHFIYVKQCNGDLSSIDALLGCGVLMPHINNDDILEEYDSERVTQILDCFVYCINWFRELINAFCLQDDALMRKRVNERLNGLICLEKKLGDYLNNASFYYKPPVCSYEKVGSSEKPVIIKEKVKKVTKKKGQKSKAIIDENDSSVLPPTIKTQADTSQISTNDNSNVKYKLNTNFFRVLDLDVLALFESDLIIADELGDDLTNPNCNFNTYGLSLLLTEVNSKLMETLPSKIKKKTFLSKPVEKSTQYNLNPVDVMNNCITIIPRICHYMEMIMSDVQTLIKETENGRDSIGLLSIKCHNEQTCLAGLFDMLTTTFSWIGFKSSANLSLLKDGLKSIATRRNKNNKKVCTLKDLVAESCAYVIHYKDLCLLVPIAVSLVTFFKALIKIYQDKTVLNQLVILSLDMLSVPWKDACGLTEKGLGFNQHLDFLLSCYFIRPDIIMIKSISTELKTQVPLLGVKNGVLSTYKCFGKSNFPLLFRASYGALHEATKSEIDKGLTDSQHIDLWKRVADIMNNFMEILKLRESRTNLLTFLKKSLPIFRLFLSHGMPMMELRLKSDPESVIEVLKTLQSTTRFLHTLHCHSRIKTDTAFMAYLPQMKLVLETLIYKVKTALTSNNCSEVFWMGNLRNKNLQGELIPSQSTTCDDDDNNEDQLPDDDQSIASDLDEDMTDPGSKTVSKMF